MRIEKLTVENVEEGLVTDRQNLKFTFSISSQKQNVTIKNASLELNDMVLTAVNKNVITYSGKPFTPFTEYVAKLTVIDSNNEKDSKQISFKTGRMGEKWQASWITDSSYVFTEKRVSPKPMTFKKAIKLEKNVKSATICATALGIYELTINGKKVGDRYFAPGFTSYKNTLAYQIYDVTDMLGADNELCAVLSGGWAVGSFVFTRQNRITAARQALLLELRVEYEDGKTVTFGTDESWSVTMDGQYTLADIYDGESFDASKNLNEVAWHNAGIEKIKINPEIVADYSSPVKSHEVMTPKTVKKLDNGQLVYDFGQNFAGVIYAEIEGEKGQKIVFNHAEILKSDGTPNCDILRSAKATATYICKDGKQVYTPRLTYMGFRYVGVSGISQDKIKLHALALYSDIECAGQFECSDERINKLQSNILWSAKSNFMEVPTDCPQRDERMGWTGDIAVFAPTACYNFNMSRFFDKWLKDMRVEQLKSGGIPNTIPQQGYSFPATMPVMAIDFWGDACILVPWAEYLSTGDIDVLTSNYDMMKKYVKACKFWAGLFGVGKHRYIWHTPATFHFGDWVAPDEPKMSGWQKRSKWTATASLCHTSGLLAKIAELIGNDEDSKYYQKLSKKVAKAYVDVFTDGNGKLKNEFQTAYVLPLAFDMFDAKDVAKAADNLVRLIKDNDYCIGTGFPGTPYLLFALADNGHVDDAYKMLTCDKCPSWLYEVKAGGTTIWERWDALKEDGSSNFGEGDGTGGMVSFNHYASGAVGNFLYSRLLGIQPIEGGYKQFSIKPVLGGGITYARGWHECPYGKIACDWRIKGNVFEMSVSVPVATTCRVTLPDGSKKTVGSGDYNFVCNL